MTLRKHRDMVMQKKSALVAALTAGALLFVLGCGDDDGREFGSGGASGTGGSAAGNAGIDGGGTGGTAGSGSGATGGGSCSPLEWDEDSWDESCWQ